MADRNGRAGLIASWLLLGVLQLAVPTLPAEGFQKVGSQDGVTIYRRGSSGPLTLGAEGKMGLPWKTLLTVLLDYAAQPAWVKTLAESRVIARGPGWVDVYQRLQLPIVEIAELSTATRPWSTRASPEPRVPPC